MLEAAGQVVILFIILVVGFVCRRVSVLDQPVTRGISSLIVNVSLPALIIGAMQMDFSMDRLQASVFIFLVSGACYALSLGFGFLFVQATRPAKPDRGVYLFAAVFANVGFIGYPVVETLWGRDYLYYVALCNIWFNLLLFTLGARLIHGKGEKRHAGRRLDPGLAATGIGFVLFVTSLRLPPILAQPMALLGGLTTPLAMLVTGSFLAEVRFRSLWTDARVYAFSLLRLAGISAGIGVVLYFAGLRGPLLIVPTVLAAMPVGVNATILADQFGGNTNLASQLVFITTLFSILSIPFFRILLP